METLISNHFSMFLWKIIGIKLTCIFKQYNTETLQMQHISFQLWRESMYGVNVTITTLCVCICVLVTKVAHHNSIATSFNNSTCYQMLQRWHRKTPNYGQFCPFNMPAALCECCKRRIKRLVTHNHSNIASIKRPGHFLKKRAVLCNCHRFKLHAQKQIQFRVVWRHTISVTETQYALTNAITRKTKFLPELPPHLRSNLKQNGT